MKITRVEYLRLDMPLAIPYTLVEDKVSKITNDIQKINLDLNITQFPERE